MTDFRKKLLYSGLIFLFTLFFKTGFLSAQSVWADRLVGFSSEFRRVPSAGQFSARQALQKPNVLPFKGVSACAWVPDSEDGKKIAFIKLGFKPQKVRQIAVAESYNAGSLAEVYLYDSEGKEYKVFRKPMRKTGDPKTPRTKGKISYFMLDNLTTFDVKEVKLVFDNFDGLGWGHLDAVGISSETEPMEAKINLAPKTDEKPEVENLGENINTEFEEILPIISPDGKTLYFDRKNHPENLPGDGPNDDIWFSALGADGKWQKAQKMPTPLNNKSHNYICTAAPDGNLVLLGNRYIKSDSGNYCMAGVSVSRKTSKNGWTFPEQLEIKNYYNYNTYSEFYLAGSGEFLLMALQRKDSEGDRDLYVCFREKSGKWSAPKHLGPVVNSAGTEMTPFLAQDGKTLYFASNGFSGYGDADMYVSKRLDDGWQSWTEPVNLGPDFNSPDWDASYSVDAEGEHAYFVSYKNSKENSADIFRVRLPKSVQPEPVLLISGRVLNKETGEPLAAEIVYETLPNGAEAGRANSNSETGEYKIILPIGQKYGYWAGANGYISIDENINLADSGNYREIRKDLYLSPIRIGSYVRMNNVFFQRGTDELLNDSYPELNRIAKMMKENEKMVIEIAGHTDIDGNPTENMKLSRKRVEKIRKYLIFQSLDKSRIKTKSFGEQKPISRLRTEAARLKNRRVEFKIISN